MLRALTKALSALFPQFYRQNKKNIAKPWKIRYTGGRKSKIVRHPPVLEHRRTAYGARTPHTVARGHAVPVQYSAFCDFSQEGALSAGTSFNVQESQDLAPCQYVLLRQPIRDTALFTFPLFMSSRADSAGADVLPAPGKPCTQRAGPDAVRACCTAAETRRQKDCRGGKLSHIPNCALRPSRRAFLLSRQENGFFATSRKNLAFEANRMGKKCRNIHIFYHFRHFCFLP